MGLYMYLSSLPRMQPKPCILKASKTVHVIEVLLGVGKYLVFAVSLQLLVSSGLFSMGIGC